MPRKLKNELPPIDSTRESIGQRIARLRHKRGLTQAELAERIGITQRLVSGYETGKIRMFDEMVVRFALALGFSADEILGLTDDDASEPQVSLRVMRRVQEIEQLPESRRKAILRTIDDLIRANT